MRVIYKYPLASTETQMLELPIGAHVLSVQSQDGGLVLWAIVDPEATTTGRIVNIIGTGHAVYNIDGDNYIGTVQVMSGMLVWHVFIEQEGDLADG